MLFDSNKIVRNAVVHISHIYYQMIMRLFETIYLYYRS